MINNDSSRGTLPAGEQPPPQPRAAPIARAPLVGRSASRQRLESAVTRAVSGTGGLCVLIGEAGIGKTRLAESVEQHARELGAAVVWGRYQTLDNAPPLWGWSTRSRDTRSQSSPLTHHGTSGRRGTAAR
ncbi:MAG TPA: ATP-binding protein [Polyangiales bacterium]|nr:ATP-binding protein [Polyangiales bacterium]